MESQAKKPNILQRIRSMDLTKGNLFWKLGLFALPMALTTILQLLYTTVDLVSIHFWTGSENGASAISANGSLINLVVVMFNGLAIGANIAIGNAFGAKQKEHANDVASTSLIFSLILGVVVGLFGFFMTETFLRLVKIDPAYFEDAATYMNIYFLGLPFLMVYNYAAQIHRAMGDSSTPFVALLAAGILNIFFDFLFVHKEILNLGVAGVAYATIISELVSAVFLIVSLSIHKDAFVHLDWKNLKLKGDCIREVVQLGLPAGLQGFFFALPNTFIQSALYQIGAGNVPLQNGAIAANNINNYNYAFIEALSSSTMAVVAQNYGAKHKENIKKATLYGVIWIMMYWSVYITVILTAYRPLLSLFVDYDNEAAIEAGRQRLMIVGFAYFLDGTMDIASSAMKGVRKPLYPAIITGICCTLFRIGYIELLVLRIDALRNVTALYAAYGISWILANIADWPVVFTIYKKVFAKMDEENALLEEKAKSEKAC